VHYLLQNELRAKCVGVLRVPAVLEYTYVYIMHIICPPRGFSWGLGAQRISRQICPDAPAQANNFPDNSAERGAELGIVPRSVPMLDNLPYADVHIHTVWDEVRQGAAINIDFLRTLRLKDYKPPQHS